MNVNAVTPGLTKTPVNAVIGDDDAFQKLVESGPLENLLRRVCEPEDPSGVIVFRMPSREQTDHGVKVIHTSGSLVV